MWRSLRLLFNHIVSTYFRSSMLVGTLLGSVFFINPDCIYAFDPACNHSVEHILTELRSRAIAVDFQQDSSVSLGPNETPASSSSWSTLQAVHAWGVLQQASASELRAGVVLIPRGSSLALLVREVTEAPGSSRQVLLSVIPSSEVKDPTGRIDRWVLRPASRAARAVRRLFSDPDVFLVSLPREASRTTPFREAPQTSQGTRPYVIHPLILTQAERTLSGHPNNVPSTAYSPDGSRIVTASDDNTARIWDAHTGQLITTLTGHTRWVDSASFSPNGLRIVTGSWDNTAKIWDAQSGELITTLTGHTRWVRSAAFSPDGSRIVTASDDHTARIWDAHTGQLITTLTGHTDWVRSAAFSPDGSRIVTSSDDHTARIWNAQSGQLITTLTGHTRWVRSAAFSPDGSRIVTGSWDHTARIWDARSGQLITTLTGHADLVRSASFSPDGSRIVTASDDRTARIWDAQSGQLITTLTGHTGWLYSASFSPDGSRIVTGSGDRTARIWAVPPYIPWDQE